MPLFGGKSKSSDEIKGGVAPGKFGDDRREEVLDTLIPGRGIKPIEGPIRGGRGDVSMEKEYSRETEIDASRAGGEYLENSGQSTEGMGSRDLPICKISGTGRGSERR